MSDTPFGLTREERKDQVRRIRTSLTQQRAKIAAEEVLCPRAQQILVSDPHASVHRSLAQNPALLRTIQVELASTGARSVKRSLAEHQPHLHPEAQALLVDTGDRWILDCLSENPGTLETETLTAIAMSGRLLTSWTVLTRPEATEAWKDSLVDYYLTGRHQAPHYSVKDYLLPDLVGSKAPLGRRIIAVETGNEALIAAVLGAGPWAKDLCIPDALVPVLQAKAPLRVVPQHLLATWVEGHPRGDEVQDLASSWSGTYNELLEAVDLVGRSK